MREDEDDPKHSREKARTVAGWMFEQQYKFHVPIVGCRSKGCSLKFYAWQMMNGVLYSERVKADPNG